MKAQIKQTPLLLFALFGILSLQAQNNPEPTKDKEPNVVVHVETEINAPADTVWEIFGEGFADIAQWASTVDKSFPATREEIPAQYNPPTNAPVLTRKVMSGDREGLEVLTRFMEDTHELEFQTSFQSGPIEYGVTTQKVIPMGENKSKVVFHLNMYVKGPLKLAKGKVKKRIEKNLSTVQQELKVYAETGKSPKATMNGK